MQRTLKGERIMRKLSNVEIAEFVKEELNKKGYEKDFEKILNDIDINIENDAEFVKNENGDVLNELSEEKIAEIKNNFLISFLSELEYND